MRISKFALISVTLCLLAAAITAQPLPTSKQLVVNKGDSISFTASELFADDRSLLGPITSTNEATLTSPFFRSTVSLDAVQDLSKEVTTSSSCNNFKDYGVGQVVAYCKNKDGKSASLQVFDVQLRSEMKDSAWNLKLDTKSTFVSPQGLEYVNHYYFETLDKDKVPHKSLFTIGVT